MTQITQNKYDLSPIKNYLKQHSNATNKELYEICNAITDSQKGSVRNKKHYWNNKKIHSGEINPGLITSLTSEVLENLICDMLNEEPTESKIRIAVDFYNKVKGKMETIDSDIDMEALREIGVNVKNSD